MKNIEQKTKESRKKLPIRVVDIMLDEAYSNISRYHLLKDTSPESNHFEEVQDNIKLAYQLYGTLYHFFYEGQVPKDAFPNVIKEDKFSEICIKRFETNPFVLEHQNRLKQIVIGNAASSVEINSIFNREKYEKYNDDPKFTERMVFPFLGKRGSFLDRMKKALLDKSTPLFVLEKLSLYAAVSDYNHLINFALEDLKGIPRQWPHIR